VDIHALSVLLSVLLYDFMKNILLTDEPTIQQTNTRTN